MNKITVTRGAAVAALHRLNGAHRVSVPCPFRDVPRSADFADAVDWASFHEIAVGTGDAEFSPDSAITKKDFSEMLRRYAVSTGVKPESAAEWISSESEDELSADELDAILKDYSSHKFEYVFADAMEEIADAAEKELNESIEKKLRDPEKHFLNNWPDEMLLIGLTEAGRYETVRRFVDVFIETDEVPYADDGGMLGYAVCELYEKFGYEKYKKLCERVLAELDDFPKDSRGQIKYDSDRSPEAQDVYVDGTGFATIFLGRYAALFSDERVRALANLQIDNYLNFGIEKQTGLTAHGYVNSAHLRAEIGWGRGTGWLMLALGSVLGYCPTDDVARRSRAFVNKTMEYVLDTDNFSWSLGKKEGPTDTSATGPIMWGILKAKEKEDRLPEIGIERIKSIAVSCLSDVKDGVVYGASGESGGWGAYSDRFGHYKWGQGGVLAFLGMLVKELNRQKYE